MATAAPMVAFSSPFGKQAGPYLTFLYIRPPNTLVRWCRGQASRPPCMTHTLGQQLLYNVHSFYTESPETFLPSSFLECDIRNSGKVLILSHKSKGLTLHAGLTLISYT